MSCPHGRTTEASLLCIHALRQCLDVRHLPYSATEMATCGII